MVPIIQNRRIIAIRPQPALDETVQKGIAMGLPITGIALSQAKPCEWSAPASHGFDAILAGSANAFRHAGNGLEGLKALPVMAVGEQTAIAARDAGFVVAHVGTGGLQGLVDGLIKADSKQKRRFLRISGKDHIALKCPDHLSVETRIVYQMQTFPLTDIDAEKLSSGTIVLLFSASSAMYFRAEAMRQNCSLDQLTIIAIGPRIADAAGAGWAAVHCAAKPNAADLLALAQSLWQLDSSAR